MNTGGTLFALQSAIPPQEAFADRFTGKNAPEMLARNRQGASVSDDSRESG